MPNYSRGMVGHEVSEMTFGQFLEKVKALNAKWRLDSDGAIRTTIGNRICCPITALGIEPMYRFRLDALRMGLSFLLAIRITYAADNTELGCEPAMRQELLKACGLV